MILIMKSAYLLFASGLILQNGVVRHASDCQLVRLGVLREQ